HYKKDHFGNDILDENGNKIPADFVSTGNNHHVAIYKEPEFDKNGQPVRSEEHTSELQSRENLVCRLLLEKKNRKHRTRRPAIPQNRPGTSLRPIGRSRNPKRSRHRRRQLSASRSHPCTSLTQDPADSVSR